VLELIKDSHALRARGGAVDVRLAKFLGIGLQGEDVVREDDDFVASLLMISNQELACPELVGVHHVEHLAFSWSGGGVLAVERGGHGTPHLCALHRCDVAIPLKVHPVGFIQLRPNQEIQVGDPFILSHQCCYFIYMLCKLLETITRGREEYLSSPTCSVRQ